MRRSLTSGLVLLAVLVAPGAAGAAWSSPGSGGQWAKAVTLPAGETPSASVSNRSVTVSWPASTLPGGAPVAGYTVRRYSAAGTLQSIGSGCSGTVSGTSCVETGVPAGSWRYSVEPKQGNWTGAESSRSSSVTVAAPALTLDSSTVGALPSTLTGSLASFIAGQTVTFRLDDPATGAVLSGSIAPSPVQSSGGASVSVTLPAGTANGSHTIYAVGSSGDVASAAVTVSVPFTIATSAWNVRDGSSGTLTDVSAQPSFAGDGLTFNTGNWGNAFSTSRYVEFDLNASLEPGVAVSGASFAFRRAASNNGDTVCFYFEVRRASTGAVVATHGSSGSPVGCVAGQTLTTANTPLPEITTSDLANDLRIRVYGRSSGSRAITIDLAGVTGTAGTTPFALHTARYTDAAAGSPSVFPWSLAAVDGTALTSANNWQTNFNAARYLRTTFPAYVPAAATVTGATFRHAHRPVNSGNTACWYAETYSGGSLLASHGSATAPVSCTTGTSYASTTLTLDEVTTPARANDLTVRVYERVTGPSNTRTTQHDVAELSVSYRP